MQGYEAKIVDSSRELTAKEKIQMKDTTDAIRLDEATTSEALIIKPVDYAVVSIHNEQSESKDYEVYVLIDKDGQRYVTGSEAFFSSFKNIWDEMSGEEEEWELKIYRMPSKNYAGREFITCSIL